MAEPSEAGTRLREWRESLEMSREALADRSGIAVGTLRNHETGVSQPKTEHLQKLAMLGCDVGWLLTGRHLATDLPPVSTQNSVPAASLDADLLADIAGMLEDWLGRNRRQMEPRQRGRFIAEAYAFCVEEMTETHKPAAEIAPRIVERFLRVVA